MDNHVEQEKQWHTILSTSKYVLPHNNKLFQILGILVLELCKVTISLQNNL